MKFKTPLLTFFFLWICINIYSQKHAYIQYTVKDGLPSNNIYMGFQDSKGYMYFGTDAGLSRFDGSSFKNFDIQDGLPDNDIFDILEDRQGRIWLATYNGKLGYLKDDKFHNSTNTPILKGKDLNSYISCMYEDKKGNIWFGTRNDGIKYLDIKNEFHNALNNNTLKYNNKDYIYHTYAIWENSEGDVCALTNYAFENLTKKQGISLKKIGIELGYKDLRHCKVLPLDSGELLFTENSQFYILDKHFQKILKKTNYNSLNTTVLYLKRDASKNIWAGTYDGMFMLKFDKKQLPLSVDFLKNLTISSRKEDTQGNTWHTTLEEGIYFSPNTKVTNYTVNDALPEEKVNAVDGNNQGNVIIGQGRYYSLIKEKKVTSFNKNPIYELQQLRKTTQYIYNVSLHNNGDYIVASSNGVIANTKGKNYYYSDNARVAINYKNDSIAIGFYGLIRTKVSEMDISPDKKRLLKILKDKLITAIYWDEHDNSFWIGLINGLLQIKGNDIFNHSNNHPALASQITDIIHSHDTNGLWISTNGKGTLLLDRNGQPTLHLTKKEGLSSNICKALREDQNGKLWIATNNGLNKVIDGNSKNIIRYDSTDGLLTDNINDVFIHQNKVWVATDKGLSMMNIDEEKNYTTPIYITNTSVNDSYKKLNNKTLPHNENNIRIDFIALDYSMGGKIAYRYKIKENQDWSYTNNNSIEFSSLKSDHYSFKVQAKNKQGIWSKEAVALNFNITKPWWQTSWAFIVYALSIFGIMFSVFKYESRKKQLKIDLLVEKKESLRFKELDQFKSQFFTNISHEIRTPLTLINGTISDLETINDSLQRKEIELKVKKHIHKITDMVDSVLDLAKIQSSNFSLQLKTTNVSNILRKQFMNFEPLFNQKDIVFLISKHTVDYFSLIDVVFFEKAINNLIINALKYTNEGHISVNFFQENQQLIIKISDTGIGISDANFENIFNRFYQVDNHINKAGGSGIGLAFCKEIIELHKGTISLKSEINSGSEFTITLPLEKSLPTLVTVHKNTINKENIKDTKDPTIKNSNLLFLIVDDNYDMRKYLLSILTDYDCLEAENGEEALEIINTKTIDFIITDYMMPKLNGYDLVTKLNEKNSNIPIIMLTAKTDISTKLDVLKLGVDDYITKPFNKNELLTRIHNCIKNNTAKKSFNDEHYIIVDTNDDFIDKLKKYIIHNSSNTNLNQDIIAEEFNTSKSSFYRKIKSTTGLTPNNFIKEIKLLKAREIIAQNSNISLKELSYEVGFHHTSYFSKIYKSRFGVKPLETKN